MAKSGSFTTTAYSNRSITFNWWINSQSVSGNYTDIGWNLVGSGSASGYYMSAPFYLEVNGSQAYYSDTRIQLWNGTTITTGTTRIYHNNDGTKSFSASMSGAIYSFSYNVSGSGSWTLDTIPRYADITQFDVSAVDETQVQFTWGASASCDDIKYSVNDGTWKNGVYPTTTISGLKANTKYNIKIKVKRTDSQLWTETSNKSVTTYDYPKITSTPDFIIGDTNTIRFYNPLGRTCRVYIVNPMGMEFGGSPNTDQKISGYTNNEWTTFFYDGIPNSKSGKYKVRLIVDEPARDTTVDGGTYSIRGDEIPIFTNFTYRDNNKKTTDITGNDQILIKNASTLEVTIPSADKMTAVKSANPKKYTVTIDNLSSTVDYDTNDVVTTVGTVTSSGTKRVNVRAYDSRDLSTVAYKDITIYDYSKPVINASTTRLNNFENQTTLKVSGTFTKLTIDNIDKNSITNVQYRYRETGGTWSNWVTLNTTVTSGKFTCSDVILSLDNTKSFEFEIQAEDKLESNTGTSTVGVGQAVFFVSSNKKACYINGQPIIMYDIVDEW